jgi:two-component system chemotaxis sensor kinase CheA
MPTANPIVVAEFVNEAREHLAAANEELLALESDSSTEAAPRLERLFRAMHSVKGGAGLVGCRNIGRLAHAMETVVECKTGEKEPLDRDTVDALLSGLDLIQSLLDDVENSDEADIESAWNRMDAAAKRLRKNASQPHAAIPPLEAPAPVPVEFLARVDLVDYVSRPGHSVAHLCAKLKSLGAVSDGRLEFEPAERVPDLERGPIRLIVRFLSHKAAEAILTATGLQAHELRVAIPESGRLPEVGQSAKFREPSQLQTSGDLNRSSTVRIGVHLLDRLFRLAGELVLVRNQARQLLDDEEPRIRDVMQRLSGVTTEVQQTVMLTRLQPASVLFGRFPRLVRDMARQLGKEIDLFLHGTEVELDKSILELLADPLTHMVRNCCDHGIERPAERGARGKKPVGKIHLEAHHEGNQIRIELRDDGRGIDPVVVRRKVLEKGLKSAAELDALGAKEIQDLIMLPGFSTAESVTDISGRGVGMDVVKTNITQLGGTLRIDSASGEGSTFHLSVPLTLAIIPCLMVEALGERYAIPQRDLRELLWIGVNGPVIERVNECEVVRLRDRLLPIVRLATLLGPKPEMAAPRELSIDSAKFVAVIRAGTRSYGLVVDRLLNPEEIVVKPMHPALKKLPYFAGTTILGDGRVALILSSEGIARGAPIPLSSVETGRAPASATPAEAQSVILFEYGPRERFAVPLAMVERVADISADRIERVADREYVRVGDRTIRIVRLDRYLHVSPADSSQRLYVLLPKHVARPIGILMTLVVDTDRLAVPLDTALMRDEAITGTAVMRDRLTLFLDLYRLADRVRDGWPGEEAARSERAMPVAGSPRRILVVDDTEFFRQVVCGYFQTSGYEVRSAADGREAMVQLRADPVDLVVTDIEMPEMDGWELARAIRADAALKHLPLLALTTLNSEAHRSRAREVGFDAYEVKLNRDTLLDTARRLMNRGVETGEAHA